MYSNSYSGVHAMQVAVPKLKDANPVLEMEKESSPNNSISMGKGVESMGPLFTTMGPPPAVGLTISAPTVPVADTTVEDKHTPPATAKGEMTYETLDPALTTPPGNVVPRVEQSAVTTIPSSDLGFGLGFDFPLPSAPRRLKDHWSVAALTPKRAAERAARDRILRIVYLNEKLNKNAAKFY